MVQKVDWSNIKKPSFFLVGAPKCGTTSFYEYFKAHPELYVSPIKEPNYFCKDVDVQSFKPSFRATLPDLDKYFAESVLQEEHLAFVQNEADYLRLFEGNSKGLVAGECSSNYLHSETAAEELHQFNPEAKIIISLRNPIERAYSHYLMAVQMGMVKEDFKTAVEKDLNAQEKGLGISEQFFELGLYSKAIKKYQDLFGQDQVLVLFFDEWVKNGIEVQKTLCQFLNVTIFTALDENGSNVSRSVRNAGLHQKIMHHPLKEKLMNTLPASWLEKVKSLYYKSEKSVLQSEDRVWLQHLYREDVEKTTQLVDRDLNNWIND